MNTQTVRRNVFALAAVAVVVTAALRMGDLRAFGDLRAVGDARAFGGLRAFGDLRSAD
jgi:hypothetical protein